jgi:hypothetical protein
MQDISPFIKREVANAGRLRMIITSMVKLLPPRDIGYTKNSCSTGEAPVASQSRLSINAPTVAVLL